MGDREFNYKAWADVDLDKKPEVKKEPSYYLYGFPQYLAQFVNRMSGH